MNVAEIMRTNLKTLRAEATVADASLVGVISQTDIVTAVAATRV